MNNVEKSLLVPYTPEQIYPIVNQAEDYPKFLPWCTKAEILMRTETEQKAMLTIGYKGIEQQFGTHNTMVPNEKIEINLLDGPFKELHGQWLFTPVGEDGCRIDFFINYEFNNVLLDHLVGPFFERMNHALIDAFIEEAGKRFDK